MEKLGDELRAENMISGKWYRTENLGRFVAGGWLDAEHRLVYIDGDSDMQSQEGMHKDKIVEVAKPKF